MAANVINADDWTLFDKIMFGGLGYSSFCLPTNFFKVIIAIMFPPLGEICNIVEDTVSTNFPYLNWETIKKICEYDNLKKIVYSFLLTTLFYIPGLVYTLTNIAEKERKGGYDSVPAFWEDESNQAKTISELKYAGENIDKGLQYGLKNKVGGGLGYFSDKTDAAFNEEVGGGFETAGRKVGGGFETAGRKVGGGFETAGRKVGGGFETAGRKVGGGFETAGQNIKGGFEEAGEGIEDLFTGNLW
jgi:uncharacterized membrane protein YqaE (UPF0057 family)